MLSLLDESDDFSILSGSALGNPLSSDPESEISEGFLFASPRYDPPLYRYSPAPRRRPEIADPLHDGVPPNRVHSFLLTTLIDKCWAIYDAHGPYHSSGLFPLEYSFLTSVDLHYVLEATLSVLNYRERRKPPRTWNDDHLPRGKKPLLLFEKDDLEAVLESVLVRVLRSRDIPSIPQHVPRFVSDGFCNLSASPDLPNTRVRIIPNVLQLLGLNCEWHLDYFSIFDGSDGRDVNSPFASSEIASVVCDLMPHELFQRIRAFGPDVAYPQIKRALLNSFWAVDSKILQDLYPERLRTFDELRQMSAELQEELTCHVPTPTTLRDLGCFGIVALVLRSRVFGSYAIIASVGHTTGMVYIDDGPVTSQPVHDTTNLSELMRCASMGVPLVECEYDEAVLPDTDPNSIYEVDPNYDPYELQPEEEAVVGRVRLYNVMSSTRGFGFQFCRPGVVPLPSVLSVEFQPGLTLHEEFRKTQISPAPSKNEHWNLPPDTNGSLLSRLWNNIKKRSGTSPTAMKFPKQSSMTYVRSVCRNEAEEIQRREDYRRVQSDASSRKKTVEVEYEGEGDGEDVDVDVMNLLDYKVNLRKYMILATYSFWEWMPDAEIADVVRSFRDDPELTMTYSISKELYRRAKSRGAVDCVVIFVFL